MRSVNQIDCSASTNWKRHVFDLAKSALAFCRAVRKERRVSSQNKSALTKILNSQREIKLELGSGAKKGRDGWTTIDLAEGCDLRLDLVQPLPLPDNSVSMIYSSHVLEHFRYHDLMRLLAECRRVLRPAGRLSVAVPNARIYLEAYSSPGNFDADLYCQWKPAFNYHSKIDYVNYMAYMDIHHKHMFDEEHLLAILQSAEFVEVRLREFDPTIDRKDRDYESIYADAFK